MPLKSLSAPIGSSIGTGCAPRRSIMVCTPRSKSAPMRSILLMYAMRGTWYLSAWRQTVSDLRLYAGDRVEQRDSTVEHAQRTLHLDGEVDVAGRVDDVDAVVVPLARGRGGRDRDPTLLLLLHPVHRRGAFVHLAELVGLAGVVEDALGRRRLARINMGHDPDVSGLFERELARHADLFSVSTVFLRRVPRQRAKKRALEGPLSITCCEVARVRSGLCLAGLHVKDRGCGAGSGPAQRQSNIAGGRRRGRNGLPDARTGCRCGF